MKSFRLLFFANSLHVKPRYTLMQIDMGVRRGDKRAFASLEIGRTKHIYKT